jgi:hypothetical protein
MKQLVTLFGAALLAAPLSAQLRADLYVPLAQPLGGAWFSTHDAAPGKPYLLLADLGAGRLDLGGETLWLAGSPGLFSLDAGLMPLSGRRTLQFPLPTGLHGLAVYSQVVLLDGAAPNGAFTLSNLRSSVLYGTRSFVGERFGDAAAAGFSGDFDRTAKGFLTGEAVRYRETRVLDVMRSGAPFQQPLAGPFENHGVRHQWVLRPDFVQSGPDHAIVGMAWKVFGGQFQGTMRYPRFTIELRHSDVRPDYRVGAFSSLPIYPKSGLEDFFANNYVAGEPPVRAYDGVYDLQPQALRQDGYMPFPDFEKQLLYDDARSLLIEFFVPPVQGAAMQSGMSVWLPVTTMSFPNSRCFAKGTASAPIDPYRRIQGSGDNTLPGFLLQIAKVRSTAVSPWYDAAVTQPTWKKPIVCATLPTGTRVEIECQGAQSPGGAGLRSAWIPADQVETQLAGSYPSLRFRLRLIANGLTGERPIVHSVIVPVD